MLNENHTDNAKSPAEILVFEHRGILVALGILEKAAQSLEKGGEIQPEFWKDLVEFLRGFADACHHAKEERFFLPEIEKISEDFSAFSDEIFAEHKQGREYVRALETGVRKFYGGEISSKKDIIQNAKSYVELLKRHIAKENKRFIEAEKKMPQETVGKMAEDFEKVEREEIGEGAHEKYKKILERIALV